MTVAPPDIPEDIAAVDDQWLNAALGTHDVRLNDARPYGDGHLADTFRLTLDGAPWDSLVLKLAAVDPDSRATAARHRSYEVEVGFYRELAADLPVHVPACHWAGFAAENTRYGLLLEFVDEGTPGDQLDGCSVAQCRATLDELALLHAPRWNDPRLREHPWIERHGPGYRDANVQRAAEAGPRFLERYGSQLPPDVAALIQRFIGRIGGYDRRGQDGPRTVVHGDLRLDNVLFGPTRPCLLDWQTVLLGHGLVDVSYFLGTSLETADRRAHEQHLVRGYHERLTALGVELSWAACWDAYRRYAFEGLAMAIIAGPSVKRSERGDRLFVSWAQRTGQQALDLDAENFLDC